MASQELNRIETPHMPAKVLVDGSCRLRAALGQQEPCSQREYEFESEKWGLLMKPKIRLNK